MKFFLFGQQGNLTLEQALLLGAAVVLATSALPAFFRGMGGYLNGFVETNTVEIKTIVTTEPNSE